jgi:hypothetical protein
MGELTRGYLSVSHSILPDIEVADPALKRRLPNARVIKKIDQAGFFAGDEERPALTLLKRFMRQASRHERARRTIVLAWV